jgi:hypothetical protein
VQRIEIAGVPVFTAPGPDRVTAALMFGVGVRDETYATLGVTHLIEHLVMGALPKSHLDCNATVDVESTMFYATGKPEAVATFLTRVCEALSDLPTDRMALEVGVLQAENCPGAHPTAAALWAARFRLTGPGIAMAGGGVPTGLSEATVRAHAERWFVRSNAALVWHGERPDELLLPLPDRPRPQRAAPVAREQAGPVWMQGPTAGVGLLVTALEQAAPGMGAGLDVLQERMRDVARHERGLSYHAEKEVLEIAAGHREVAVLVDAREGQEAAVARLLWEQYLDLCERGPSPAELAHAVDGLAEQMDDAEEAVTADLGHAALASLFDLPTRTGAEMLAAWRKATRDGIAAALRTTLPTAVLMVPEGVDPGDPAALPGGIERAHLCNLVAEMPEGTTFRPPLLVRARFKQARMRLVVGDAVLAHQDADGDAHVIPWGDVEAAVPASEGEGVFVVGRNLCGIDVHEEIYGRRAVEAVRARIPGHLWLPNPAAVDPGSAPAVATISR